MKFKGMFAHVKNNTHRQRGAIHSQFKIVLQHYVFQVFL